MIHAQKKTNNFLSEATASAKYMNMNSGRCIYSITARKGEVTIFTVLTTFI